MPEPFDPYRKWLGIPEEELPPNHYRLLGLADFESDEDVIAHAADRQMAYVRTFQSGPHGRRAQELLNELSAAKVSLLNTASRRIYDGKLRAQRTRGPSEPTASAAPPLPLAPPATSIPAVRPATQRPQVGPGEFAIHAAPRTVRKRKKPLVPILLFAISSLVAVCVIAIVMNLPGSTSSSNIPAATQVTGEQTVPEPAPRNTEVLEQQVPIGEAFNPPPPPISIPQPSATDNQAVIRDRAERFATLLIQKNFDGCVELTDPNFLRVHGSQGAKLRFHLLAAIINIGKITEDKFRIDDVSISPDARSASVSISLRSGNAWKPIAPQRWLQVDDEWYVVLE